jgi:phosphomethylpyrimidine synthase
MCGQHFCSMKVTEEMRDYVAETGISDEAACKHGTKEKSRELIEMSAKPYAKA